MAKFEAQGVELEAQRQQILKNLEDKQVTASKHANEYDEKQKGVAKILDQLNAGEIWTYERKKREIESGETMKDKGWER